MWERISGDKKMNKNKVLVQKNQVTFPARVDM